MHQSTTSFISSIPFEILLDIFKCLEDRSDIIQSQLVCRHWHHAASEILYETIEVSNEQDAASFLRAISSSKGAGSADTLVKTVSIDWIFQVSACSGEVRDAQDVFGQIAEFCPNVVKLIAFDYSGSIYVKLMHAVYNGQLQCLQYIPNPPSHKDIELYAYAALAFKRSLRKLVLYEQPACDSKSNKIYYKAYDLLTSRLKEFKVIRKLKIDFKSSNNIICFDPLFQDCPVLTSLYLKIHRTFDNSFVLEHDRAIKSSTPFNLVMPRPGIKTYKGFWELFHDDNSLQYFMLKFPQLDQVTIRRCPYQELRPDLCNFSTTTLLKFFKFISRISSVNVYMVFARNVIEVWAKLIEDKEFQGSVCFDYDSIEATANSSNLRFGYQPNKRPSSKKLITTMACYLEESSFNDGIIILPHMELMDRAGTFVQQMEVYYMKSLQKQYAEIVRERHGGNASNNDSESENDYCYKTLNGYWLDDIFHCCTSFKSLTLYEPGNIELHKEHSHHWINESLERLEIVNFNAQESGALYNDLSMRLPSLYYFHLNCPLESLKDNNVTIDMPFTSFTTLFWQESGYTAFNGDWKAYLKVAITGGTEKFFVINEEAGLAESSKEAYQASLEKPDYWSFDIQCKQIENFWMKFVDFEEKYSLNCLD